MTAATGEFRPEAIPLSIYLHWPWCVRKCPYCDFNSHAAPARLAELEGPYADALLADLETWLPAAEGRPIVSIFLGGGTPSLMAPATVGRVLEGIARRLPLEEDCEVTLEANPGTIDERRLQGFRAAGVNRLSIGVQSFSDERLARLGRIHSAREAREAVAAATRTFENLNLDLMYALPGETPEDLALELREAAASGATHLSCYQLTIEPGTAFARRVPEDLPDEDVTAGMGDLVGSLLAERGFGRYEVSGYAQPGRRCRHNLNYWTFGDYLAAGAGAHGKLSTPEGVRRETRAAAPAKYLRSVAAGSPAEDAHVVPAEDLPFEFMLNALRLLDGVPARLFTERTDLPLSVIEERLAALRARGLLEADPALIRPTRQGLDFLSDLQEAFL